MPPVRPAAVAGYFYPADPIELADAVRDMLGQVQAPPASHPPKVIIVPHAGYVYSGPVAATAYHAIAPWAGRIRRVILLGPSHRVALRGLALPEAEAFATPQQALDAAVRQEQLDKQWIGVLYSHLDSMIGSFRSLP